MTAKLYEMDFFGASPLIVYDASGNVMFDASAPTFRKYLVGTATIYPSTPLPTVETVYVPFGKTYSERPWYCALFTQSGTAWHSAYNTWRQFILSGAVHTVIQQSWAGTDLTQLALSSNQDTTAAYMVFDNGAVL